MIDIIYINEAVRIRKEYLENTINSDNMKNIYDKLLEELVVIREDISNIKEDDVTKNNEEYIYNYVTEIYEKIEKVEKDLKPYLDKDTELNNQQRILYKTIKDRYTSLTDEDLYNELIPYIIEVDNKFEI